MRGIVTFFVVGYIFGLCLAQRKMEPTEVYVGLNNKTVPLSLQPTTGDILVSGDQFGHSVALSGSTCLIGASKRVVVNAGQPQQEGIVYVFKQNDDRSWADAGYTLQSFVGGDGYGQSIALYGTTAAVGAPKDDSSGANSGRAYAYHESSGSSMLDRSQVLYAQHPEEYDYFGFSVAVVPGDGYYPAGTIVVGAYGHTYVEGQHKISEAGAVFVFPYSSTSSVWYMAVVLQPSQPYENGFFGWSVSGFGNAIAVGAPGQEAAFLFHLEPVMRECPPDGRPEDTPDSCREVHHRRLQGGAPRHNTYSSWEYVEVLHVQNNLESYKGDKFGHSVSVVNSSTLTMVVGSPGDNGKGTYTGAVYIISLLPGGDVWSSWSPDHPDDHDNGHHHRSLQDGGGGSAAPGGEQQGPGDEHHDEPHEDEHHHNIFNIRSYEYAADKDGNAWMLMKKVFGSVSNEMYGSCTAVSDTHILVGVNGGPYKKGRAELLVFDSTNSVDTDSPIFQGPLYMKEWRRESILQDSKGGQGDYFGSALALDGDIAVVGGFLTGFVSSSNIGTGAAYIYDATALMYPTGDSTVSVSSSGWSVSSVWSHAHAVIFPLSLIAGIVMVGYFVHRQLKYSVSYFATDPHPQLDSSHSSIDANSSHPLQSKYTGRRSRDVSNGAGASWSGRDRRSKSRSTWRREDDAKSSWRGRSAGGDSGADEECGVGRSGRSRVRFGEGGRERSPRETSIGAHVEKGSWDVEEVSNPTRSDRKVFPLSSSSRAANKYSSRS